MAVDTEAIAEQHSTDNPSVKRKRDASAVDEIEVDLDAPEPPSKKAKRQAKKGKSTRPKGDIKLNASSRPEVSAIDPASSPSPSVPAFEAPKSRAAAEASDASDEVFHDAIETLKVGVYGVWIGNLHFTCTKADLRTFLTQMCKPITGGTITRIHMPLPHPGSSINSKEQHNKGFAYVDFTTPDAQEAALALSETTMRGRNLLVKRSSDFQGRPELHQQKSVKKVEKNHAKKVGGSNPPNTKVWVGNLGFETTEEDVKQTFEPCGTIANIHMATFEDSGRSKGYAWVTFETVEAATSAATGWVMRESDDKAVKKSRKYYVNRIHGRAIKCEFAEHASTRYRKRFGKSTNVGLSQDDANGPSGGDGNRRYLRQSPDRSAPFG
ncbi:RNA-binding domain-containing protein [Viridothelium virens]|uniref:RNA-binding domain-containing protein n=1 Tax=Viridothelium virens TaxID=1048519 RepID=A0A6A6HJZ6_VIRVR|nr:RNA-binding domain-containing protein [Viridothelium virens]